MKHELMLEMDGISTSKEMDDSISYLEHNEDNSSHPAPFVLLKEGFENLSPRTVAAFVLSPPLRRKNY
jgi:hypothetical protein